MTGGQSWAQCYTVTILCVCHKHQSTGHARTEAKGRPLLTRWRGKVEKEVVGGIRGNVNGNCDIAQTAGVNNILIERDIGRNR